MSEDPAKKAERAFVRREHFRYPPKPLDIAYIDLGQDPDGAFTPKYPGLIIEASAIGGCCLAVLNPEELYVGKCCRIKLGDLQAIQSEVRWEKAQDLGLTLVGFRFIKVAPHADRT